MERIGKEVERELARGGAQEATPLAAVISAWPTLVGDAVARHAWPARIGRDGTLHVNASSATWAFELDRLAPEMEARFHAELGDAAPPRLRFTVGPVPEPVAAPATQEPLRTPPETPPAVAADADAAAAAIDDPELRELVSRAARASLLRTASDRRF